MTRRLKFYGWGCEGEGLDEAERARLLRFVADKLGAEPRAAASPPLAADIVLRAPRISAPAALAHLLTQEPYERLLHTYGKSFPETVRAFARDFANAPDLVALPATEADIAALRQAVERMTSHVDNFAIREESDREFHLRLAEATGNGSLETVVEGLWNQRAELWGRMQHHFHTKELAQQTIRDHAAIVRAVAARDPDAARAAMHRHLGRVAREFQRGLDDDRRAAGDAAKALVAPPKQRKERSVRQRT